MKGKMISFRADADLVERVNRVMEKSPVKLSASEVVRQALVYGLCYLRGDQELHAIKAKQAADERRQPDFI